MLGAAMADLARDGGFGLLELRFYAGLFIVVSRARSQMALRASTKASAAWNSKPDAE